MSRLYFTTEDTEVEVKGWEYHWLRGLADEISSGFLGLRYDAEGWIPLINKNHYMGRDRQVGPAWGMSFETALHADGGGGESLLVWNGHAINGWHLMLNTAVVMGGDAVKLGVRLGSQAEIHAWIDGPDRAWVADIIDRAVTSGVFREGLRRQVTPGRNMVTDTADPERFSLEPAGWDKVTELLRSDDKAPVVTWYSISESFPDNGMTDMGYEDWEDLPSPERWRLGMESLRGGYWSQRYTGLQIKPDDWNDFRFGHKLTVMDLRAPDRDRRIQYAVDRGWL